MTGWRERAACQGADLAVFFPDGRGPAGGESNPEAEAICRRCPVRQDCLEEELAKGGFQFGWFGGVGPEELAKGGFQFGWFGGVGPEERSRIVRKRRRTRGAAA